MARRWRKESQKAQQSGAGLGMFSAKRFRSAVRPASLFNRGPLPKSEMNVDILIRAKPPVPEILLL